MYRKGRTVPILIVLAVVIFTLSNVVQGTVNNTINKSSLDMLPGSTTAIEAGSNRYTMPETNNKKVENKLNTKGYTKIMEDNLLEVWLKEKNASIRIVNKKTGYIWGGLASDYPEDLNETWSEVGNGLVSIDYFDNKAIERKESISNEYVVKKYKVENKTLKYNVDFSDIGISFDFEMALNNGSISFAVNNSSIKENGDNSLGTIYFVPFLGSTHADDINGYMFVPDGPGALIRFSKPAQYLAGFDKRIYGKDFGIDSLFEINDLKSSRPNDFTTDEPTILMPVFGMVHGAKQNAWFAQIDNGTEYAKIQATPSGMLTDYNWITAKFIYRQKYLQPTSRNGAGVQIAQKARNSFDAKITYKFLDGDDADYVGMAKFYRSSLQRSGILKQKTTVKGAIPLEVDVIAADKKKGFLFDSVLPITTPAKVKSIFTELSQNGVKNITTVIQGWQKGGLNGYKPSEFKFESKLGGKEAFQNLSRDIDKSGGQFYFYENPVTVNESQLDLRKECANTLSQTLIDIQRDNFAIWYKDTYFIEPKLVAGYITKKTKQYVDNDMNSMAINGIGDELYAENQHNHVTSRSEALKAVTKAVQAASSSLKNLAIYNPNLYLWKYTKDAFNMPVVNSQYLFETDTVPFLQIVLKGSINYYSPYSNESFYSRSDILKLIEYGTYPAFQLTGLGNNDLEATPISELYSTRYEDWKDKIVTIYKFIDGALSKVEGKLIINRTVLNPGVVKVDYENNISILVNYTSNIYNYGNIKVQAQDYAIVRGR